VFRWLLAVSCLQFAAWAQTANEGSIGGYARNARTHEYLDGASVSLAGTAFSTTSERDGSFHLKQVPAGTYRLLVSYAGLDPSETTVTLTAGQVAHLDVALTSEVYQLNAFVVAGQREGNAQALMAQKNAPNVINAIAMDAYGNVADGNIGNFLQKLPGLMPNKQNGDVEAVSVRGIPSELNSVEVDGTRLANAFAGGSFQGDRALKIDEIPADLISKIVVTKAPTPDMAADAIGGNINLVSKSAFEVSGRYLNYRTGANLNTYRRNSDWTPSAGITYLDTFGPKRNLGIAFTAGYSKTENPGDALQPNRPLAGPASPDTRIRMIDDIYTRTRTGEGLRLDYRLDDRTSVYASINYAWFDYNLNRKYYIGNANTNVADYSRVSLAAIEAGATPLTTAGASAQLAPGYDGIHTQLLNLNWQNVYGGELRKDNNTKFAFGGRKQFDSGWLNLAVSDNPSQADDHYEIFLATVPHIGMAIDSTNPQRPVYQQIYGPSVFYGTDWSNYTGQIIDQPARTKDTVKQARADYHLDFLAASHPAFVQVGVNIRDEDRSNFSDNNTYNYVGADGVAGLNKATGANDDNIAQFAEARPAYALFNGLYPAFGLLDYPAINRAWTAHPTYFAPLATNTHVPDSRLDETVSAVYAMGNVKLGALSALFGVRGEKTQVKANGVQKSNTTTAITLAHLKSDYTKYFPGLHLRYEPVRDLVLRASASTSIGRAAISQLEPTTTVTTSSTTGLGTVAQNNTGLQPQYSRNLDLSAEYYTKSIGVLSVGAYQKNIRDFIQSTRDTIGDGPANGFGGAYAGYTLASQMNLGSAKIQGAEFNYQQQLSAYADFLKPFAIMANATYIHAQGQYSGGATALVGFAPKAANIGLSYNRRGFEARVFFNYNSGYLYSFSTTPALSNWIADDHTVDVNLQYTITPRLRIFADLSNIFNFARDWYSIDTSRIIRSEVFGSRLNIGISGRF
jgi:iron complex outermembrane recepter protein